MTIYRLETLIFFISGEEGKREHTLEAPENGTGKRNLKGKKYDIDVIYTQPKANRQFPTHYGLI